MKETLVRKENVRLNYNSPLLVEELGDSKDKDSINISGTMIKAKTSRNNVTYNIEELKSARFSGKTISVNHDEDVKQNVGHYEPKTAEDGINFEGIIHNTPYNPGIVEMIRKGLIKFVSIEAIANEVVKEGDNFVAKGLDFTGLGFVKTPGFEEATFAIAEAFKGDLMTEETKPQEETVETTEETKEETKEETTEEKKEENLASKVEEALKNIEAKKVKDMEEKKKDTLLEDTSKKLEALEAEVKKLKEEPSKGIITDTQEESKVKYTIEENRDGTKNIWPKNPEECY